MDRVIKMEQELIEKLDIEMAMLIRKASSMTAEKRLGNLDRSGYLILHYLSGHRSQGIKALAEEFRLDASTMSRQIAALEIKGYVERLPDPNDGRASLFQLTDLGSSEFLKAREARFQRYHELFGEWTEDEGRLFLELIGRVNRTD